jgi:DNA-binding NarL/FixJ family response regulator
MAWFSKRQAISAMTAVLPRAEILRRGRIAVLDDEPPEMLQDLRDQGLSVDHLASTADPRFNRLAEAFYDLLLLDYGGIGGKFGEDEGLDVLKYLKRVNPGFRVVAFTARTFDASKGDFFRLCDGIIKKDAGIRETLEQVEFHLGTVLTPAHQFQALTSALGATADQQAQLEKLLSRAIAGGTGRDKVIAAAKKFGLAGSEKLLETLVTKAIELGAVAVTAAS